MPFHDIGRPLSEGPTTTWSDDNQKLKPRHTTCHRPPTIGQKHIPGALLPTFTLRVNSTSNIPLQRANHLLASPVRHRGVGEDHIPPDFMISIKLSTAFVVTQFALSPTVSRGGPNGWIISLSKNLTTTSTFALLVVTKRGQTARCSTHMSGNLNSSLVVGN